MAGLWRRTLTIDARARAVSHLTLFISSNMGDEEVSALSRIQLIGQPIHMTNMSDLKKGG